MYKTFKCDTCGCEFVEDTGNVRQFSYYSPLYYVKCPVCEKKRIGHILVRKKVTNS